MLERDLERKLTSAVKAAGGWAVKVTSPAQAGLPDRLCLFPGGRVVWIELKTPTGRVSAIQAAVHRRLQALGFDVRVIRTTQEIEDAIKDFS